MINPADGHPLDCYVVEFKGEFYVHAAYCDHIAWGPFSTAGEAFELCHERLVPLDDVLMLGLGTRMRHAARLWESIDLYERGET